MTASAQSSEPAAAVALVGVTAAVLGLFLFAFPSGSDLADERAEIQRRAQRARALVPRIETELDTLVELGEVEPLLAATESHPSESVRRLACIALGRIGGELARDRLLELLQENTNAPERDGWTRQYAAAGLAQLRDPGTAVDLLLNLAYVDQNNHLASRASRVLSIEYFTIDAQICDALLGIGVVGAADALVDQMLRKDRIRVSIDALEVLRRRTGLTVPFRYNGSDPDREADGAAWRRALATWKATQPAFDASGQRFQERCREVVGWLEKDSVRHRFMAQKVLRLLGQTSIPFLTELLASGNNIGKREAAFILGNIGSAEAIPALKAGLSVADPDARAESARSLLRIGSREAAPALRPLLEDPDAEVRSVAARFLGKWGEDGDRELLRKALKKERVPTTTTALWGALLLRGDRTAVPPLTQIFEEGDLLERRKALASLRAAAGARSLPGRAEDDPEQRRRHAAEIRTWFERN